MPTSPKFDESLEPAHTRLDGSAFDTIYVVGDVHGCIVELRRLWDRLNPGPDDIVVFVGDLVGKGPASDEVVTFVRVRDNALSVRGNNEHLHIHGDVDTTLSPVNRDAIESFPLVVSWNDTMVVHGGVHPDWPLDEHTAKDLLEMRALPQENGYDGPFWFDFYEGSPRVVFGHTVLAAPLVDEWTVGLDTGCVHGGWLTAYDCRTQEVLTVSAEQTYRRRSDDRILQK